MEGVEEPNRHGSYLRALKRMSTLIECGRVYWRININEAIRYWRKNMIKRHWKRIILFLIGLDIVVFGGGSLICAYMALSAH